jgi:hypothetical protein
MHWSKMRCTTESEVVKCISTQNDLLYFQQNNYRKPFQQFLGRIRNIFVIKLGVTHKLHL